MEGVFINILPEYKYEGVGEAILSFPTMFSTPSKTEIIIFITFNLSSANAFNFVWSNTMYSILRVCDITEVTLWEKEKLLVQAISPFPQCFYYIKNKNYHFYYI